MKMSLLPLVLVIASCATAPPARTSAEMRAARIAASTCPLECAQSERMEGDPNACCTDRDGVTWSICAWNMSGRDETARVASDAAVFAGTCGGDGWLPCGAEPSIERKGRRIWRRK